MGQLRAADVLYAIIQQWGPCGFMDFGHILNFTSGAWLTEPVEQQ